jgi:hypothetical protein
VRDGDVEAALGQPALDLGLHLAAEIHLGEADVAVIVALDVGQAGELVRIELVDQPPRRGSRPRSCGPSPGA